MQNRVVGGEPASAGGRQLSRFTLANMVEPIQPRRDRDAPARVIAVLSQSTVRVLIWPGVGMLDGGVPAEIPIDLVPFILRMPNTEITVSIRDEKVVKVAARVAR